MKIRRYNPEDTEQIVSLIADFRVFLASLKSLSKNPEIQDARVELDDYLSDRYRIYVAEDETSIVGYLVCKIDQNTVWAESLFVIPSMRRKGIGSALYSEVESLAQSLGGNTVYNWVHPNNEYIICFLKKRGFDVLNLVELRKPWPNEKIFSRIDVGKHQFRY
ncbi:MAG: GNAT family N-acetyltransferase [Candidatus Thorarchaeota archaeon]